LQRYKNTTINNIKKLYLCLKNLNKSINMRLKKHSDSVIVLFIICFFYFNTINALSQTLEEPALVFVKGGAFSLGRDDGEVNEKPLHTVVVNDFYIGKYEITNLEYCQFLNEQDNNNVLNWINLSGRWDDDTTQKCRIINIGKSFEVESGYENYPVTFVNWYGAVAYCKWLSDKTGKKYRLPTEAEWEYAARSGGKDLQFVWGNEPPIGKLPGNFADETFRGYYPYVSVAKGYNDGYVFVATAGSYEPNFIGVYDMAGNLWEWCSDWYHDQYVVSENNQNPVGPLTGDKKVCRGGSWLDGPANLRVARRVGIRPQESSLNVGFRIVKEL